MRSTIEQFCQTHGTDRTYWLAYSGGLDSHVLLHLFASVRLKHPVKLRAIYINHHISPFAEEWALHCEKICYKLGVEFIQKEINVNTLSGDSIEEIARKKRYAAFAELLKTNDILLTAHHQDDQAETLLLQMLRGAGVKGLAAMPHIKPIKESLHARPLLNFTRDDLKNYAIQHQLDWVEDESNQNTCFSRNFIRHDVMPLLQKKWPMLSVTLSRVASHCGETQKLLEQLAIQDRFAVKGKQSQTLSVSQLLTLSDERQRLVLRSWLYELGFTLPSDVKIREVQRTVLFARCDKMPYVKWKGAEIRRYQDDIYALKPLHNHDKKIVVAWNLSQPVVIPNIGTLHASRVRGQGLRGDISQVTVRFRQGGEICRLQGREHHHCLKKLFQQKKIPPWLRDRVPLLYVDEQLAAAVGVFIGKEYMAKENEEGYLLSMSEE